MSLALSRLSPSARTWCVAPESMMNVIPSRPPGTPYLAIAGSTCIMWSSMMPTNGPGAAKLAERSWSRSFSLRSPSCACALPLFSGQWRLMCPSFLHLWHLILAMPLTLAFPPEPDSGPPLP